MDTFLTICAGVVVAAVALGFVFAIVSLITEI